MEFQFPESHYQRTEPPEPEVCARCGDPAEFHPSEDCLVFEPIQEDEGIWDKSELRAMARGDI